MTSQEEWETEVRKVFSEIAEHDTPRVVDIDGWPITIYPNVFAPDYFTDSAWFAEELSEIVGTSSLLEIGTGTGIIALRCAINGASVVGTDINPYALDNARHNFELYKQEGTFYLSDIYDFIPEDARFNFLFWNHPFHAVHPPGKKASNPDEATLLKAGFDPKYEGLERYVKGAERHLSQNGRLLLGTGASANLDKVGEIVNKYDRRMELLRSENVEVAVGSKLIDEFRIYELVRKSVDSSYIHSSRLLQVSRLSLSQ